MCICTLHSSVSSTLLQMSEIKIYARFRPLPKRASRHKHLSIDDEGIVRISVGDKQTEKFSGNPYSEHLFKFNQVFDENATQQQVFDGVIVEMIDKFLEGFNGTFFAYGQTASGKTYTIEGGARQFDERGIIPRTISYIYSAIESRKKEMAAEHEGQQYLSTIHISYLEVYQDIGYDLLNPGNRNEGMMLNLPKVSAMEGGPNDEVHVRHLSSHLASNEEMALSLLFQGSTCRRVAETTMNMSSSRSHAIFTITLSTQKQGSDIRIRSKLNLVDLAGSERVYKTCATGQILQEAKHINLSLHYLEHVIVVLQKQALANKPTRSQPVTPSCSSTNSTVSGEYRQMKTSSGDRSTRLFVPYRNSLLTMVLKDSLGGNCITAMIANLSLEKNNLMETLSTCRFSQRVACISNKARRNEEIDNEVLIKRLKEKVVMLQRELEDLKSTNTTIIDSSQSQYGILTDEQKKKCHKILYNFLHGKITDPVTEGINSPTLFTEALTVMKDVITQTIKENKKYKQKEVVLKGQMVNKSVQVSAMTNDRPNVQSPLTYLSTSPQSRISSGFVSLKDDDDLQSTVNFEKPKKIMKSSRKQNNIKEVKICDGHSSVTTPTHETRRHPSKSIQKVLDSKQVRETEIKSSSVPPPIKSELARKEKQHLIRRVDNLNQEMLRNSMKLDLESVTAKLAIQQAKVAKMQQIGSSNLDEIITEKKIQQQLQLKLDRVSAKLDEMKNDTACNNGKQTNEKQINKEIEDLRLEKLQKQLELKEAATMRRLLALKSELLHNDGSGGIIDPKPHIFAVSTKEDSTEEKHRTETKMERTHCRTSEREQKSVELHCEPNKRLSESNGLQSPGQSSEKLYSKELQRHKTRVIQIRKCMKAAIVIQRAWRQYKKKKFH